MFTVSFQPVVNVSSIWDILPSFLSTKLSKPNVCFTLAQHLFSDSPHLGWLMATVLDRAGSGDSAAAALVLEEASFLGTSVPLSGSLALNTATRHRALLCFSVGVPVFWTAGILVSLWWSCSVTEGIVDRGMLLACPSLESLWSSLAAHLLGLVCSYHPGASPAAARVDISCAFALVVDRFLFVCFSPG